MLSPQGQCLRECMVYEAKVSTENNFKRYYGTCEGEFKSRFYNHSKSFRNRDNETELPKYIWQLKDESKNHNMCWKICMTLRSMPNREICHCACRSGTFTKQEN